MLTTVQKAQEALGQSLRFCLYPRGVVERFGVHGLHLTRKLLESGAFLHLFSAVDIVCSFFSGMVHSAVPLPPLPLSGGCHPFVGLYSEYPRYIGSLFDRAFFRMVKEDVRHVIGYNQIDRPENDLLIYRGFSFIIAELALECPFVTLSPPFPSSILNAIQWESIAIPERRPLDPKEEQALLESLGFNDPSGAKTAEPEKADRKNVSAEEAAADPRVEVLFSTVFQWYQERRNGETSEISPSISIDLARLPQSLDYKLIDSYLDYFDQFELDEDLRHKISFLQQISRISIEKSPFITEYSKQWTSGAPNPAFLIQGWKRFVLKMLEGAPVFLGKPDPLFDQDRVAVRFYFFEELRAGCEKVSDAEGRPRFSHLNVHKLTSLLIAHDLVRHLGAISKMDMSLEFIKYSEGAATQTKSTGELFTRTVREKVDLDEGFMVKNRLVQGVLLLEPNVTGLRPSGFDEEFFSRYFEGVDSRVMGSPRNGRCYDFFFGCGGTFMKENGTPMVAARIPQQEFSTSPALAGLSEANLFRTLPNHPRGFVCETNSRYVLASGSETGIFKSAVIEQSLAPFLNSVRRFVLHLVTDEAIRFRLGYIERIGR